MRGGDDERDGGSRADAGRDQERAVPSVPGPDRAPDHERPGAQRTRDERARNQRAEVREADKAEVRRVSPYSTEQRMMAVFAHPPPV